MAELFDEADVAGQVGEIGEAILAVRSLRLTDIAVEMEGESAAGYKRIQRFLQRADPRLTLWRLFQEDAEFVIRDPTEIERPQAWKTEFVGKLKDRKTRGFWALTQDQKAAVLLAAFTIFQRLIQPDVGTFV